MPTAVRGSRRRWVTPSWGRIGSRTSRSTPAACTRIIHRTAPSAATARPKRCGRRSELMDELAIRLGMDPLELRLRNVLQDGDVFATGEVVHDVNFVECLRASADSDRLGRRSRREGPLRRPQGHADTEPRLDRDREGGRQLRPALRDDRDGPGRAPRVVTHRGEAPGRRARARALPRPRHRSRPVRHADDFEPLDPHDGSRARGRRRRPPRKRRHFEESARS